MPLLFAILYGVFSATSAGGYNTAKSLTIPGWIVIPILFLLFACGSLVIIKMFRKSRGKLK